RYLVSVYSCPMHGHIEDPAWGRCPVCGMVLVRTTREFQWTCPDHPDILRSEPGECPYDRRQLERRTVEMPHGDHNPRHGGMLFMAPDGFHHLEGTLSESGLFRLYLYDNFTKPIDATPFLARIEDQRLQAAGEGAFLEVQLGEPASYPAEVVLHVRFDPAGEEQRFDFIFPGTVISSPPTLSAFIIPRDSNAIVDEILERNVRIRELTRRGAWAELFIPALEAKDLALALSAKEGESVALPVKTIVRAAWLLDLYGDLGNKPNVESAYRLFVRGIQQLRDAYGP
ncbi:MAG: heavy metal-binding domain-containing protein, partial [Acidobacteriota bacterium]